jgi:hypothetical protein
MRGLFRRSTPEVSTHYDFSVVAGTRIRASHPRRREFLTSEQFSLSRVRDFRVPIPCDWTDGKVRHEALFRSLDEWGDATLRRSKQVDQLATIPASFRLKERVAAANHIVHRCGEKHVAASITTQRDSVDPREPVLAEVRFPRGRPSPICIQAPSDRVSAGRSGRT